MTDTEKRQSQTENARRARAEQALARRIEQAADLLRERGWSLVSPQMKAAGWEVIDAGPVMVIDRENDQWVRGRDGKYYLMSWNAGQIHETGWTLNELEKTYGLMRGWE